MIHNKLKAGAVASFHTKSLQLAALLCIDSQSTFGT